MAPLTIPAELLPEDGRFGCGPTKVPQAAGQAVADAWQDLLGTSHRQAPVKDLVARLQHGLAELFGLPGGYEVLLANGGATAFWDMATFGLIEQRSQHHVLGEFSAKFARGVAAAPWLDSPDLLGAAVGGRPAHGPVPGDVDTVALVHNETSTGVMEEIRRPDGDQLVLVDATSGAGGLPVDPTAFDAYYFSLQKGFASDGGLVLALVSPAALDRIEQIAGTDRYVPPFLDLPTVVSNSRKHQTYNTPAIATILMGVVQVEAMLADGGLDAAVAGCREKAAHLYGWAEARDWATPFVSDPAARSLVVGTVDLAEEVPADRVTGVLRDNGVVDSESYRKLGRNQLRVGMFPAVTLADVQAYTACVDHVVDHL